MASANPATIPVSSAVGALLDAKTVPLVPSDTTTSPAPEAAAPTPRPRRPWSLPRRPARAAVSPTCAAGPTMSGTLIERPRASSIRPCRHWSRPATSTRCRTPVASIRRDESRVVNRAVSQSVRQRGASTPIRRLGLVAHGASGARSRGGRAAWTRRGRPCAGPTEPMGGRSTAASSARPVVVPEHAPGGLTRPASSVTTIRRAAAGHRDRVDLVEQSVRRLVQRVPPDSPGRPRWRRGAGQTPRPGRFRRRRHRRRPWWTAWTESDSATTWHGSPPSLGRIRRPARTRGRPA